MGFANLLGSGKIPYSSTTASSRTFIDCHDCHNKITSSISR
jgi:hypothetical protein